MCWAVQGEVSLPRQRGVLGTWRRGYQGTGGVPPSFFSGTGKRHTIVQMLLTNLLPLGRQPCWRGGSTASRQLSEVKHASAQLVLRWVATLEPWVLGAEHFSPFA